MRKPSRPNETRRRSVENELKTRHFTWNEVIRLAADRQQWKSVAECWKVTRTVQHKLETFQTKCLQRIVRIFWPNMISNTELLRRTDCEIMSTVMRRRRWRQIGHVCRMPPDAIPKVTLRWTADGRSKRGRPKETWRRSVEKIIESTYYPERSHQAGCRQTAVEICSVCLMCHLGTKRTKRERERERNDLAMKLIQI